MTSTPIHSLTPKRSSRRMVPTRCCDDEGNRWLDPQKARGRSEMDFKDGLAVLNAIRIAVESAKVTPGQFGGP